MGTKPPIEAMSAMPAIGTSIRTEVRPAIGTPTATAIGTLPGSTLTRRRAVDYCRVATALCRAAHGSQPVAPESCGAAY
jgi:hypothetical protein